MSADEEEVMRGEEEDQVRELPSSSSTKSKLNRSKSRPKFISRVSLVSALKEYTSNEALNFPTFDVLKETTKFGIKKRQKRTFEVDIRNRAIRNLSRAGSVHKKYNVSDIDLVQRVPGQNDAIDLKFRNANHAYRLLFAKKQSTSSVVMRERFYQLLCLLQCKEAAEKEVEELAERETGMVTWTSANTGTTAKGESEDSDLADKPQSGLMEALDLGLESIRVVAGTFNLGGKQPPTPEELDDWLPIHKTCDVYAIGVQECNYKPKASSKSKDAMASKSNGMPPGPFVQKTGDACDQDWLCTLNDHFSKGGFVILGSHSIQHTAAIKLSIYVHKRHLFKVKNVFWDAYACGVANMYGNKGAVGCRFYFNETPLTFINVHLAAHEGAAHDRNVNTANILQKLSLGGHPSLDVLPQSSYLFYLGDLNYRVNIEYSEAVSLCKESKQGVLVAADELCSERALGRTLSEMNEVQIEFPPTYRYNVPRERYELSFSNKKNQTPSYTDRILYHACPETEITPLEYCSVPTITTSDHIPVRATFDLTTNLPFSMNPGSYLGQTKRLIKFKRISAKNIKLASPLLKGGTHLATGSNSNAAAGNTNERSVHNPSFNHQARGVGVRETLLGTVDRDASEALGDTWDRKFEAKQNQKRVNLSIKFFWPFGFDGKCKTKVVEASAMESGHHGGGEDYEGDTHSINADWGEDDLCLLFPRVMCTEQLGSHPLAFQLIETRPLSTGNKTTSHVIGTGKISLVKAAQHMTDTNDEGLVVDTWVVKHGIRRGILTCSFTANLEYH
ncbi:inositol phosphatase [Chloropicon primus]|uniref:Inositol phosphatase n=1 Tax=Chloropicon primus TaxID=1764295 RepID=A0A5B8MNJ3_9CHLO|nr:inositol phosphatase [Chloropicon primus]UPR01302.1 inositol phosphatase [Chloropicon primus]|eukprot:QDZ22083.1 inositol phosphatase [Chloropicon primus]